MTEPFRSRAFGVPAPPQPAISRRRAPARTAGAEERGFPVYLVEPERSLRITLTRALTAAGFETRPFAEMGDLEAALPELAPGCVVVDIFHAAALSAGGSEGALHFPTILLFASLNPDDAVAAVRLGAADLLRRPVQTDDLVEALRRAQPRVRDLTQRLAALRARAAVDTLTRREREVMECVMHGLSNKETALALGLSHRTVEMHRARLHRRLAVGSLGELLALAWRARSAASTEAAGAAAQDPPPPVL